MPFVWQEHLFMVHSVFPQRVFRYGLKQTAQLVHSSTVVGTNHRLGCLALLCTVHKLCSYRSHTCPPHSS